MIILECRNASSFTAYIIVTIQYALAEFFAVICHACINVVLIFIVLGFYLIAFEMPIEKYVLLTSQKQTGFSHPTQPSMQSVWQGQT